MEVTSTMTNQSRALVLVIDDDPDFHRLVEFMLGQQGYDVLCVTHPQELSRHRKAESVKIILLDWQLGDVDGTTMISPLRRRYPMSPVIFVTRHSSTEIAAASIKLGAFDFLTKPLDSGKLMVTLAKAKEHYDLLEQLHKLERGADEVSFENLVGTSPQMQTVYCTIRNVAPTDVNVMICGESGTGKELVAAAVHQRSDRKNGRFVPINMASIPADLAESTLFGHEKGAFTGADKKRPGAIGEAAGGTLFLDEITEMPIELQSKMLRFLQERVYRPVGGSRDLKADARIISATNREPARAVAEKRLREDLFYRLNVVPIILPALREREGDIPLLATDALHRFAKQYGKNFNSIEPSALDALEEYAWPGNVRQLVHVIQRAVVLNEGETLEMRMLPPEVMRSTDALGSDMLFPPQVERNSPASPPPTEHQSEVTSVTSSFDQPTSKGEIVPLEELERTAIAQALELCDGSAYEAASRLGISTATMYRRIKLYGLDQA